MLHHFYLPLSCETASPLYKYMFILVWETADKKYVTEHYSSLYKF